MKKLIVFVFILLCFCILTLNKQSKNPLLSKQNVESVCLVTDYEIVDSESVYCGNLVFNYCDITQANGKINQLKNNIK